MLDPNCDELVRICLTGRCEKGVFRCGFLTNPAQVAPTNSNHARVTPQDLRKVL